MRMIRCLLAGVALTAILPALASSQSASRTRFEDSFFLGAKVGNMWFWTSHVSHTPAPLLGAELLMTRTRGALYVSLDQAFFNELGSIPQFEPQENDSSVFERTGDRTVRVEDMRRFTVALFGYPSPIRAVRPYGGLGATYSMIQRTTVEGSEPSEGDLLSISEFTNMWSLILMAGGQAQLGPVALFAQLSYAPNSRDFVLGRNASHFLEAGVRYRLGAMERDGF